MYYIKQYYQYNIYISNKIFTNFTNIINFFDNLENDYCSYFTIYEVLNMNNKEMVKSVFGMATIIFDEMWRKKERAFFIRNVTPLFDVTRPDLLTVSDSTFAKIQKRLRFALGGIERDTWIASKIKLINSPEYKNFKRAIGAQKYLVELASLVRGQSEDCFNAVCVLDSMYKNFLDMED
jgi:hypothetical protein